MSDDDLERLSKVAYGVHQDINRNHRRTWNELPKSGKHYYRTFVSLFDEITHATPDLDVRALSSHIMAGMFNYRGDYRPEYLWVTAPLHTRTVYLATVHKLLLDRGTS